MLAVVPSGCRVKEKRRLRWRRASRLWFAGQRYDAATQLNYNYFRDYHSSTGRYVQSDPIGLKGGISTYAYANNSPLSFVDSLGLAGQATQSHRYPANRAVRYWLTVVAHRDSGTDPVGHAFGVIEDDQGNVVLANGFWPHDEYGSVDFLFDRTVPGVIRNEEETRYLSAFIEWRKSGKDPLNGIFSSSTYALSEKQFGSVMIFIKHWDNGEYSKNRMCGTFVQGLIQATGNTFPQGRGRPADLYESFKYDNR